MYLLLKDSASVAAIAYVVLPVGTGNDIISKFELRRSPTGEYYFVLLTDRDKVIAASEMDTQKESALTAIRVMKRIAVVAAIDDRTGP